MRAPCSENCLTLTDTGRLACVSMTAMSYSDLERYMLIIHGCAIIPPITTYLGFQSLCEEGAVVSLVSYFTMCSPSATTTVVLGT